jgi:hypothetical protein
MDVLPALRLLASVPGFVPAGLLLLAGSSKRKLAEGTLRAAKLALSSPPAVASATAVVLLGCSADVSSSSGLLNLQQRQTARYNITWTAAHIMACGSGEAITLLAVLLQL